MQELLNRSSVVIGLVTVIICLFALTYPAGSASVPSEVLSPVVGDLEVVSSLEQCSGAKWCFNQYKSGGHAPGGGICQADDTYAWDTNLNTPEFDWDKGKPVYAVEQGVVAQKYGGDCINAGGSYGQLLIEHKYQGNTWWSGYLHLKDIQVSLGQSVDKNTLLGYISNISLESIPNHLHFVVYKGENSRGKLVSFNANIVTRNFSPKFNPGDYVQTTANLHLRTDPEIDDNIITTIPSDSTGQIVEHEDNGIFDDGYCWWNMQFGSDNGWCVEDWLEEMELSTTKSVFTVVGTVKNADDTLAADGLEVAVSNETKKLTAITILGEQESGRYGVAFVDTENKTVAAEGDSLKVTVKREGDIVGSQIYKLTSEDIVKARAIVDVKLGTPERIRPSQAAQLAKTVLGAPYVARKGYEYISPYYYFDEPEEITQKGLDCSGLNFWSYNRAYFSDEPLTPEEFENRPLYWFGADMQYHGNIEDKRPTREELKPGDLLFFDVYADSHKGWEEGYREIGQDGHIDHVAMYVGAFTYEEKEYDVVHATLSAGKVTVDTVDGLIERLENLAGKGAFVNFGRVKDAKEPEFKVIAASPVNLIVTDPDGEMITKEMGESVTMEYMVYDINGDGKLDDIVASPERKTGNYQITVAPEPDVSPTDTYSLEATFIEDGEATTFIATDIPITTVAAHQYTIDWKMLSQGEKGVTVQMDSDGDGTFEKTINTGTTFTVEEEHPWDVNSDGIVDISDLEIVGQHFGESPPSDPRADVNGDGTVDISDLALVGQHFGE
jgi:cell wall-associated NlpC family hydrolase